MGKLGVLRQRKDGGISFCFSSEENVGKRNCCHIPAGESFNVLSTGNKINLINIETSTYVKKAKEADVKSAFQEISKLTTEEEKELLLNELR